MNAIEGEKRIGLRRSLTGILAVVGALSVVLTLMVVALIAFATLRREGIPRQVILELDLERGMIENVPEDALGVLLRRDDVTIRDVIEALKRAETDDRVRGLIARAGTGSLGLAQVEEIRAAIVSFRATGKPAIIFAETFGEFASGRNDYYLATAFDEIHLQPSGDVGLAGIIAEQPFLAGALELAGVEPQMDHRYEYKDALNLFTQEGMTDPQREATLRLVTSVYENLVEGIATGRGIAAADVRRLIDGGPYYGEEAVRAGLVDRLSYRDEVFDSLQARLDGSEFLFAERYLASAGGPHVRGESIALIYGTGSVQRGESQIDPLVGGAVMGSESVTRAFRDAVKDENVRAIVFRVDSPGGSYVASDAIWRETLRAKAAGKPVIVTMGNVAGSGGYFVAMGADRIVAQPSTFTGSIGVYAGKMLIDGLSEKLGVTWDDVRVGGNATMWSSVHEYSPEEWIRLQDNLDRVYEDFTAKAALGRGLTRDSIHAIARGRVWTGADAHELGLIDELGGFDVALRLARELARIPEDDPIRLRVFPRERSLLEMLFDRGPESSQAAAAVGALTRASAVTLPLVELARDLGLLVTSPGVLSMPVNPTLR